MNYTSKEVYKYISEKTDDPIQEWKVCEQSGQAFPIYKSDGEFYDKLSPRFDTDKEIGDKLVEEYPNYYSWTESGKLRVQIPTPRLCPEERQRRRFLFRNERKLYKRKCDFTGKDIISIFSPDKECTVYDQEIWWSDQWNAEDYGLNWDGDDVFSLLSDLIINVPSFNLLALKQENSYYTNHTSGLENCYQCFSSLESTNCLYSWGAINSNGCVDCAFVEDSSHCFECISCAGSYKLSFSQECVDCSNSQFLYDCVSCTYCYNCNGLRNKSYCINNKQYSEEEYYKVLEQGIGIDKSNNIRQGIHQIESEDCSGNHLINCKDCQLVADLTNSERVKYTFDDGYQFYSYDCYGGSGGEYCMEVTSCAQSYHTSFMCYGNNNKYSLYCNKLYDCSFCFASVGLRNKSYCIFNKQYTENEWHNLVPQIIADMISRDHWGEFFSPSLSPFGYNETIAQEYYPLNKNEAKKRGYKRSDYHSTPNIPDTAKVLKFSEIGNKKWEEWKNDDAIIRQVIICSVSGKPFMVQRKELEFYRKHDIPLPKKHPDIRHKERMSLRPGKTICLRECDKCTESITSVYSDSYHGKVYCKDCYEQEVYG